MVKTKDISLSLVRTIKASPEKVFSAWTDPKTLKRWMSPTSAMDVAVVETDLKIGGRYRIVMREPGGKEHRVGGTYTVLERNGTGVETLVTITLRKKGEDTELTLTHAKFADGKTRDMHNEGWLGCVGRLEKLMAA